MILAGIPQATRRARAKRLLESVGIGGRMGHTPSQLSGGEQQRVTIARALSNKPDLLLLDEPTGDLDTLNEDTVMRYLTDMNELENVTCVMVTHEMSLRAYAHKVIHMLDGKVQRVVETPTELREAALAKLRAVSGVRRVCGALASSLMFDACLIGGTAHRGFRRGRHHSGRTGCKEGTRR